MSGDAFSNLVLFGGAVLAVGIGAAYFAESQASSLWQRCLTSAYGPAIALVFALAAFAWPDSHRYNAAGVRIFMWLQVLPLGLLAYSLIFYRGRRGLHWLLVPLALVAWAWTFALGFMGVNGMQ
jgi:hypothetical protein